MNKPNLGISVTGSFCTLQKTIDTLKILKEDYELFPVLSFAVRDFDTRFFEHADFREKLDAVCENPIIDTIQGAETIGPKNNLDAMLVLPCTGNTLAKLAAGITDTPVTMAVKAHVRNLKPVVICVSTNDGLSASLKNIAALYNKKYFYIAPFRQDDYVKKTNSLVVNFPKIPETISLAMRGVQIQPLL